MTKFVFKTIAKGRWDDGNASNMKLMIARPNLSTKCQRYFSRSPLQLIFYFFTDFTIKARTIYTNNNFLKLFKIWCVYLVIVKSFKNRWSNKQIIRPVPIHSGVKYTFAKFGVFWIQLGQQRSCFSWEIGKYFYKRLSAHAGWDDHCWEVWAKSTPACLELFVKFSLRWQRQMLNKFQLEEALFWLYNHVRGVGSVIVTA